MSFIRRKLNLWQCTCNIFSRVPKRYFPSVEISGLCLDIRVKINEDCVT